MAKKRAIDLVQLDPDHPGFRDPAYRARRNAIVHAALDYVPPAPAPLVEYTESEQSVWRAVNEQLRPLHQKYASRPNLEAYEALPLPLDHVPQLRTVNAELAKTTGFQMNPVGGLVSPRAFMAELGQRGFLSTQYMRHPSVPYYTPEPDVVHELIGHAATLAHPLFADLNVAFGLAMGKASDEDVTQIERIYWYTIEFGLVREGGELKAFGAGLLSSFGELDQALKHPNLKPWDLELARQTPYDPTKYQPTLFVVDDLEGLSHQLGDYLAKWH
ncbi:MAG: phenylalanine 4-monooxygenase [Myxococcaceae bacterium]